MNDDKVKPSNSKNYSTNACTKRYSIPPELPPRLSLGSNTELKPAIMLQCDSLRLTVSEMDHVSKQTSHRSLPLTVPAMNHVSRPTSLHSPVAKNTLNLARRNAIRRKYDISTELPTPLQVVVDVQSEENASSITVASTAANMVDENKSKLEYQQELEDSFALENQIKETVKISAKQMTREPNRLLDAMFQKNLNSFQFENASSKTSLHTASRDKSVFCDSTVHSYNKTPVTAQSNYETALESIHASVDRSSLSSASSLHGPTSYYQPGNNNP